VAEAILRPNATIAVTGWEPNPHLKLVASTLSLTPLEDDLDPLSSGGEYVASTVALDTFEIAFDDLDIVNGSVESVVAWVRWRAGLGFINMRLKSGSTVLAGPVTFGSGSTVGTSSLTFEGDLLQEWVNNLRVQIDKDTSSATSSRVGWVFLRVTYTPGEPEIINIVDPAITGIAETGEVLTCSDGSWTPGGLSFEHQWQRNSSDISGANVNTYTLVEADEGQNIRCEVTASLGETGSGSAFSNTVIPTAPAPEEDEFIRVDGVWVPKGRLIRVDGGWY
jgi:hypothetical protein